MTPPVIHDASGRGGGDRLAAFQSKYCRMCALELRQGVLIFGNEGQRLQLPEKIRKTVSILVLEEDSLPKKICTECCSSLEDYSKYKDTVLDAQEKLTSIVRNLERSLEASACEALSNAHSLKRRRNVVEAEIQREKATVQAESSDQRKILSPDHSPAIIYSVDEGDDINSPDSNRSVADSPEVITQAEENVQIQEECNVTESKTLINVCSVSSKNQSNEDEVSCGSSTKLSGCESQTKRCEISKSYQLIIPSPSKNNPSTSSASPVALVVPKDRQKDVQESGLDIKCGLCGFLPLEKKDIKSHHSADHDLLKYPSPVYGCPECPRITENFNAMRIHLYRHKQDDRFKCKECYKSYAFENQLKCHVLAAHNPNGKAFSCKICGKRFSAKCSLVAHMTSKHPVSSEEKNVLDETKSSENTEIIAAEVVNINKKEEPCSSKSIRFGTSERNSKNFVVQNDMISDNISDSEPPEPFENSHEDNQESETKTKCAVTCDSLSNARSTLSPSKACGATSAAQSDSSTKLEGKSEKDEGVWKCEYCDKILQSESGYRIHIKKHRGKRFHCDYCQAIFTQAGSLKHHILTKHPGVLPIEKDAFSCSSCEKVFATKKRLRDHQRLHKQPETALNCSICKKSYKSAEHLRFHMRYHQNNDHQCSSCEKSFKNIKQLQCHENTHTGSKPFKCTKCSAEFGNSGSHYKHVKKCNGSQGETVNVASKTKDKDAKEVPKASKPATAIPQHVQSHVPCEPVNNSFAPSQCDPPVSQLSTETVTVNIQESNPSPGSNSNSNILSSLPNIPTTQNLMNSENNPSSEYLSHASTNTLESTNVTSSHSNSSSSVPVTNYSHQQYQGSHPSHHHQQSSSTLNHYQQTPWQTTSSTSLTQGQMTGTSKPFLPSQQPSHSHAGNLGSMELVDCEIHHSLGSENLSAHNLSYPHHHGHVYSSSHHSNSSNQHATSHGQNVSPHSVNSSLPVSTTHSGNSAISSTNSSLIITSSHASHQSHTNSNNSSRCHQSEPMELSYKLQLENSEFQDMPMELTKVFQRDPLELCVRQDFNPLMDLSSRVQDGHGMHMNSMNMTNGMNSNSGSGNCGNSSLVGISMYHNKLDMVERDLSFSDLSGAFRQPIDLIARPEDSHNLCSEGNLVDLSLRSAAFGQDQSASTFLRELIDLSARSDSFHGELNLTNKNHHQQHSHGNSHQNHHSLHHHGPGNHNNNATTPMNKSSSGGNGQSHHVNGTSSFQNLYHDSIFSMQNQ